MSKLYAVQSAPHSVSRDAAPVATPLDTIFIQGLCGQTVIGIHDDEIDRSQPVVIDLVAGRQRLPACDSDRIGDTIDYSVVHARLLDYLQTHRHRLLEAFAEGIAEILLGEFGADWVQVAVAKPRKFEDVERVGVQIERRRGAPGLLSAQQGAEILSFLGGGLTPGGR